MCIISLNVQNNNYHVISRCEFKWNVVLHYLASEWLRVWSVSRALWPSIYLHMTPFSAEETCGSCLFCPYLGMADELWQLMSEQPVKETACNEESAAWETDAIIFQMKLFHSSVKAVPVLAGSWCRWLPSHDGLFWEHFLFVFCACVCACFSVVGKTCENVAWYVYIH